MAETPETPAPTAPTERQLEVLRTVADYQRAHGYPPTVREIGEALGIAGCQGVTDHLKRLQVKGLLLQPPKYAARALTITAAGWAALGLTPPSDQAEVLRAVLRSVLEVAGRLIQEARHHHRGRGSELVGTSQGDLRYLPRLLPLLREIETTTTAAAAELQSRRGKDHNLTMEK